MDAYTRSDSSTKIKAKRKEQKMRSWDSVTFPLVIGPVFSGDETLAEQVRKQVCFSSSNLELRDR